MIFMNEIIILMATPMIMKLMPNTTIMPTRQEIEPKYLVTKMVTFTPFYVPRVCQSILSPFRYQTTKTLKVTMMISHIS